MLNKLKEFDLQYKTLQSELSVVLKNPKISNDYKLGLLQSTSVRIDVDSCSVPDAESVSLYDWFDMERSSNMPIISILSTLDGIFGDDLSLVEDNLTKEKFTSLLLNCGATHIFHDW